VYRPDGKKLLAKGHIISDDIRILESDCMEKVWVTELEDGEVGGRRSGSQDAPDMGCGCYEIHLAAGGRACTRPKLLHFGDEERLRQINSVSSVVIATSLNFSFAAAGQRIATVKSAPFAEAREPLDAIGSILRDFATRSSAVLYTDRVNGERAR
jgi:molybdenum cofactor cytidylyltransferase